MAVCQYGGYGAIMYSWCYLNLQRFVCRGASSPREGSFWWETKTGHAAGKRKGTKEDVLWRIRVCSHCNIQLERDRGEYQKACAEIDEVSERLSNAVSDSISWTFCLIMMFSLSLRLVLNLKTMERLWWNLASISLRTNLERTIIRHYLSHSLKIIWLSSLYSCDVAFTLCRLI